jgi:nicotinamide-nucleotide amidase
MKEETLIQLATRIGQKLKQKGWFLTTAESCTGGGVAQIVTEIAGSSAWFDRGFVTYSNAAKQDMLNVEETTLLRHGAVSEQTVLAMAKGALANSQAQISIAISGIAGPSGGTQDKPVGTVWIAWGFLQTNNYQTRCYHFKGDRQTIRYQAVLAALQGIDENIII